MINIFRNGILLLFLFLVSVLPAFSAGASGNCYDCHDRALFEKKVVHAPVAKQRCDQCHNPHLARYEALLHRQDEKLCAGCHQTLLKRIEEQSFPHQPVEQGQCLLCHDPHASQQKQLLRDKTGPLCLNCHKELQEVAEVQHRPFAQGKCSVCHDAHSSDQPMLLSKKGAALCLGCHENNNALRRKHLNRDLSRIDCLECHSPHQSENKALLRNTQHQPFAQGDCQTCHNKKTTGDPCLGCHTKVMDSFNQMLNHVTSSASGPFCFNCHTPHASQQAGLVRGYPGEVCRNCHSGKFERRKESLHLHPHAERCLDCHQLHGASDPAMLKGKRDEVCVGCHEDHNTFSHPTGDAAHDPRNGRAMTCVSCHDPCNGTVYKYNLRGTSEKGLCVQCHAGY